MIIMTVKDKVTKWFIQKVIVPRNELIDNPGFIATQFTEKKQSVFLREMIVPESVFISLEKMISEKYGKKGRQVLYSAGKKFTYHYAYKSLFPSIKTASKKDVEKFLYNFVRYAEATSYGRMEYTIDIEKKKAHLSLKDYMVCPHNGLGYIFSWGSMAGLWAYLMSSPSLEGVQIKCQGQGYENCEVFCAPPKELEKMNLIFYKEPCVKEWPHDQYNTINRIRKTEFAKTSFKQLIDSSYFSYKNGVVERKKQRYFITEASFLYILEKELKKLNGANKILFNLSFEAGKKLAEDEKDPQGLITDIISSFGFGDVLMLKSKKYSVTSRFYPWSHLSSSSPYSFYSGFLSGILSQSTGKKVILKRANKSITDSMTLTVSE